MGTLLGLFGFDGLCFLGSLFGKRLFDGFHTTLYLATIVVATLGARAVRKHVCTTSLTRKNRDGLKGMMGAAAADFAARAAE